MTTETTPTPAPTPQGGYPAREKILSKYPHRKVGEPMPRSKFLTALGLGWTAFGAMLGGGLSTLFFFLVPRVNFERSQVFNVGPPDRYPPNSVDETFKVERFWVVRDNERIVALNVNCTHLGCTPNWAENENKFKCPCHGSGFRGPKGGQLAGINFEGPAPIPLRRCKIWLSDEGNLMVDRSILFEQQKGEWENPQSFVLV
jgi:cytochrome b6-f complex iron-sulfur subunit